MKKIFDDNSYIEIIKSPTGDNHIVSICARDFNFPEQITLLSVELSKQELLDLIEKD